MKRFSGLSLALALVLIVTTAADAACCSGGRRRLFRRPVAAVSSAAAIASVQALRVTARVATAPVRWIFRCGACAQQSLPEGSFTPVVVFEPADAPPVLSPRP